MMAVCMFWLLTYVGQGLDLAVGNRPVIIMQGAQEQDYRHGSGIRKKSELNSVGNNLLHFRIYPPEASHRDDLSNWLLLNDEPRISSWTPAGILIDDMIREPRELQTVFFALSPAMLNMLYSEYMNTATQPGEQFLHEDQQQQPMGGGSLGSQRTKKLRIDCRHSRNTVSLPIRVCDDETGRKSFQETRQSNYDDLFEQKLNTAANMKTDSISRGPEKYRDYQNGAMFVSRPPFGLDTAKPPGKRSQTLVGRRSMDLSGESTPHQAQPPSSLGNSINVASQIMFRSTRGSIQYDVPQIECPISEDGMERFACPTADRMGRYHCIDDHALCDGFIDCPTGEDEDRQACMFYKTTVTTLEDEQPSPCIAVSIILHAIAPPPTPSRHSSSSNAHANTRKPRGTNLANSTRLNLHCLASP